MHLTDYMKLPLTLNLAKPPLRTSTDNASQSQSTMGLSPVYLDKMQMKALLDQSMFQGRQEPRIESSLIDRMTGVKDTFLAGQS